MTRFPILFLVCWISAAGGRAQNPALTPYGLSSAIFSFGIKVAPCSRLYFTSGSSSGGAGGNNLKAQALAAFAILKSNLSTAGFALGDTSTAASTLRMDIWRT